MHTTSHVVAYVSKKSSRDKKVLPVENQSLIQARAQQIYQDDSIYMLHEKKLERRIGHIRTIWMTFTLYGQVVAQNSERIMITRYAQQCSNPTNTCESTCARLCIIRRYKKALISGIYFDKILVECRQVYSVV